MTGLFGTILKHGDRLASKMTSKHVIAMITLKF